MRGGSGRVTYVVGSVHDGSDDVVTGKGGAEGDGEEAHQGEDGGGSLHVVGSKSCRVFVVCL